MSVFCGEPLGRLGGRFWSSPAPEASPAGEKCSSPSAVADGTQGASPFHLYSPSPASSRSLSSSMEDRALKRWHKKSSQIARDRVCGRVLDDASWDASYISPPAIKSTRSPSDLRAAGLKIPVLPPSAFPLENVINADDWTLVQSRRRRPPPSAAPASRNGKFKHSPSMVWTKRMNGQLGPG
jgi:hypothetical protein